MRHIILALALFASTFATAQQAPRHAIVTGTTYVGTNPEVGGSTPFQLTIAHKRHQIVNPAGAITIKLPSVGVVAGDTWKITNRSTNKVSIQDSAAFALNEIVSGTIELVALAATPTGTGTWFVTSAKGYWITLTPAATTGFGTITSNTSLFSRDGETMHVIGRFFAGTVAASTAIVTLPYSLTIGRTTGGGYTHVGRAIRNNAGANQVKSTNVIVASGETDLKFSVADYTAANDPMAPQNATAFLASSEGFTFNASLPITQWKTNP
jgi:hypothetical protein